MWKEKNIKDELARVEDTMGKAIERNDEEAEEVKRIKPGDDEEVEEEVPSRVEVSFSC